MTAGREANRHLTRELNATMSGRKVAVVTGSNKGIGLAIVRGLCQQWNGDVYLTARDEGRGQASMELLQKEGLSPKFHQLDITDNNSVATIKDFLVKTYGGLDILVNNAGIAYKQASTAPFTEQAEVTLATNYWATSHACITLFPILRSHARVVNVSSMTSQWALAKCGPDLKARVLAASNQADVDALMTEFVASVKDDTYKGKGWPDTAYGTSKMGVTALSLVQQQELDKDTSRTDLVVNACCPGYVDTDMTSHKGPKTPDQGADTPVFLALLPENEKTIRGKFVSDRKIGKWHEL